jgi:DNA end-binding protein Ku
MAKSKQKRSKASSQRASWRGQMTFGLVSFSVEAFNAFDKSGSDIHFHQLHKTCHRRIRYAKMCPVHGEVSNEDIVSGYEYKKGKYVEIEAEELEKLRTENDRALKIDAFVAPGTIDPLYFDGRMYYLVPEGAHAQEAYAVVAEAMAKKDRYGVGQIVFSGKEQIVLVRPLDGILHMAMLNYEAEIRSGKHVAGSIKKPKDAAKQLKLAQTLIDEWSQDDFDFSQYEDKHRAMVKKLVEAKVHGHEIVQPKEEEKPAETLNLMEALKRSVETLPKRKGKMPGKARRRSA